MRLTWKLPVDGVAWIPALVEAEEFPPVEGGTTILGRKESKAWVRDDVVQFPLVSGIHAVHSRTMVVMIKQ